MAKLHVFALAHTASSKKYGVCAYTGKVQRFCKMMSDRGHEVIHYGNEGSEDLGEKTTHVQIFSKADQERFYGQEEWFQKGIWFAAPLHGATVDEWNRRAVYAAQQRTTGRKDEFVCLIMGRGQMSIAEGLSTTTAVEFGVGYEGTFTQRRCFESYAWMHHVYGLQGTKDGIWYDSVVPNYFDPEDFTYRESKDSHVPYFLFMSRLTHRKGYQTAIDVTRHIGAKLVIAGAAGETPRDDAHVEYVGIAGLEQRRELLAGARALFVPTYYLEPFGGVVIEAGFSGTPVITTDWGAFPETVIAVGGCDDTGFRCRTFKEFIQATENICDISPAACRHNAETRYSMDAIGPKYDRYFDMLSSPSWYAT